MFNENVATQYLKSYSWYSKANILQSGCGTARKRPFG